MINKQKQKTKKEKEKDKEKKKDPKKSNIDHFWQDAAAFENRK